MELENDTLAGVCSLTSIHEFPEDDESDLVDAINESKGDYANIVCLCENQLKARAAAIKAGFVPVATYNGSDGEVTIYLEGVTLAKSKRKVARRRR